MTQACSLSYSAADANGMCNSRRLPKGIHIVGTGGDAVPTEGGASGNGPGDETGLPWGYIHIQHMSALSFEDRLGSLRVEGDFKPKCFVHRSVTYRKKPNGKGVMKEEKPSVSGLVFLQGNTRELRLFLHRNLPRYFLVNDCSTGRPASIADSLMRPFMRIMEERPDRVTFLRDPFVRFAKDHVKLRVLTGVLAGQEGYVVRILRNRQLVMNLGGYAVAINDVHNEDFEIAE